MAAKKTHHKAAKKTTHRRKKSAHKASAWAKAGGRRKTTSKKTVTLPPLTLLVKQPVKKLHAGKARYETAIEIKESPAGMFSGSRRLMIGPMRRKQRPQKLPKEIAHIFA